MSDSMHRDVGDSARVIQAAWRSYLLRKKRDISKTDVKLFINKNDAEFRRKLQNFQRQRLLRQQKLHVLSLVPANEIPDFIQKEEYNAILKIQAIWRGILTRKNLNQKKDFLERNKCAIKIQRWFRMQMKVKREEILRINYSRKLHLTEDRISFLQTKIDDFQSTCKVRLNSEDQRKLHTKAQEKLQQFYSTQHYHNEQEIRRQILLNQLSSDIEALSKPIRLHDLSIIPHCSSSKLIQSKSKQLHELTVKNLNRPWRKKVNSFESVFSE